MHVFICRDETPSLVAASFAVSIDEVYALEELFKELSNQLHKVCRSCCYNTSVNLLTYYNVCGHVLLCQSQQRINMAGSKIYRLSQCILRRPQLKTYQDLADKECVP